MVDLYHLQHIKGNITHTIQDLMPLIGHIQVNLLVVFVVSLCSNKTKSADSTSTGPK